MGRQYLGALVLSLIVGTSALAADDELLLRAREAGLALARGDFDEAIAVYTEVLKNETLSSQRRATLLTDRGVAYARRQSPREAIEDFNSAIKLFPEYAAIYNNRGNVLLGIGAVGEAMKDFNRALILAPGYAAAYSNRAGAYMKLGRSQLAFDDYTKAIRLVPVNPAALTGRGRAHLTAHRPQGAIRDFTRAVGFDSRFSAAYRSRAEAKMITGSYKEAVEDFSRAVAFDPRNPDLYVLRGEAYLEAGNLASAIKDLATAIDLNPRNARAYVERGFAYAKAEAYDEALNDFARALELEPRSPKAYAYRAWSYRQRQPELALQDVEVALKLDAASAEAYWVRGEIHEAQGRGTLAVADFEKALSLDPRMKRAELALQRLGILRAGAEEEVVGAGLDGWRVFANGWQYVATNEQYPRLKVDIEMMGKGLPRILAWEVKSAPFADIGVLRFHAGVVDARRGPEEIEQVAIVDLQANSVVAVETQRRGTKLARMTWDEGTLVVASADGTKGEYALRPDKSKEIAAAPPKRQASQRRRSTWSPWGSTWNRRRGRPKTLFELLFGN